MASVTFASLSMLSKLPQPAQVPAKRDPIWTACQGDTPALRFGNDTPDATPPADAAPAPADAVPASPAPAVGEAPDYKLLDPAAAVSAAADPAPMASAPAAKADVFALQTPAPEAKLTGAETPAPAKKAAAPAKNAPFLTRVAHRIKQATWTVLGLSTLASVGAPTVFFATKPPTALVQADQSAAMWNDVSDRGFQSSIPAIQQYSLEAYMADLLNTSVKATPGQQPIKLSNGFTLGEKEHQILAKLVEQGKTAETWQDTLALYNNFADEYLVQFNSKESVDASKAVVGQFFAANAEQLNDRSERNHLLGMIALYGMGGMLLSGGALAAAKRLRKTPKLT